MLTPIVTKTLQRITEVHWGAGLRRLQRERLMIGPAELEQ